MTVLWIVLGVLLLAVLLFLFLIRPRRRRDTSHLEGIAYAHRGYHAAPIFRKTAWRRSAGRWKADTGWNWMCS